MAALVPLALDSGARFESSSALSSFGRGHGAQSVRLRRAREREAAPADERRLRFEREAARPQAIDVRGHDGRLRAMRERQVAEASPRRSARVPSADAARVPAMASRRDDARLPARAPMQECRCRAVPLPRHMCAFWLLGRMDVVAVASVSATGRPSLTLTVYAHAILRTAACVGHVDRRGDRRL